MAAGSTEDLMRLLIKAALPFACAWARQQESAILRLGVPLEARELEWARRLGVRHPEQVRLRAVAHVPPVQRLLRRAAERMGCLKPHIRGMTLRYGIFIRSDCWGDRRLLIHELAHVTQYERLGGFRPFLEVYLLECVTPGYPHGPLEQEAKRAETELG
jgi:hypothetical protein